MNEEVNDIMDLVTTMLEGHARPGEIMSQIDNLSRTQKERLQALTYEIETHLEALNAISLHRTMNPVKWK